MATDNVFAGRRSAKAPIGHGRFDKSGAHCVNPNPALRIFQRGGFRQADHSVLARTIGGHPSRTDQPYNRCHIYNCPATTLLEHLLNLVLQAEPDALEIDVDGSIPIFFGFV